MSKFGDVFHIFQHADNKQPFRAGEKIFEEGQIGQHMYGVVEGEVDIVVGSKVVETVGAGSLIGEMALIDDSPRSASAIARTNAVVVPMDAKRFQFLVQQTPFFALQVMHIMAERIRRQDKLL